jgi:hypothetical protein
MLMPVHTPKVGRNPTHKPTLKVESARFESPEYRKGVLAIVAILFAIECTFTGFCPL